MVLVIRLRFFVLVKASFYSEVADRFKQIFFF